MSTLRALVLLVPWLLLAPLAALAVPAYDTYALGDGEVDGLIGQVPAGGDIQVAFPFEVPAATSGPLDFIRLRLRHSPDLSLGKGDFILRLREDDGGEPGEILETWVFLNVVNAETDVTFPSDAEPVLLAGETYWLNLLIAPESGAGLWIGAAQSTTDMLFADTGAENPVWMPPVVSFPIGLALVELPEPGHAWLALAGAAVLLPFGRRRARV